VQSARPCRAFLSRLVSYLVAEAGIRQFLDLGSGLPSVQNVHEVAQSIAPESRVVYVDNDPIVLRHAQVLLTSCPQGATGYIEADIRDPGLILERAAETLDFRQPVAVMLLAVLHLVTDAQDPAGIIGTVMDAVPPGSTSRSATIPETSTRSCTSSLGACPSSTRISQARYATGSR
jgi:hypothetical protein